MKTAQQYLREAIGYDLLSSHMTYADALQAVQAAIDDAVSVRQQVRQALDDYFGDVVPEPAPSNVAPIRLGERLPQQNVFPPACPRCLQRGAECLCPPLFPPHEEPPF